MLTQRMIDILKAIIDEFISTAEPVGSKTLVDKYGLPYSSATIRNDMAVLESLGYLEKPHTSAGRVPSNKGYKYYCEHLLKKDVDEEVKYAISTIFDMNKATINIEDALKESCKMISDMTNLTSGMLGPDANHQLLEHIQAYPLDLKTVVCIFITNTGHTESKTFNFYEEVSSDDIKNCVDILNERLKGTVISDLTDKLNSIKPILVQSVKQHEMLFNAFVGAFAKFATETLFFNGSSKAIYQPEYADVEKLKDLIRLFDNPQVITQAVKVKNESDVVAVTPKGTELLWKDDLAIVSTEVKISKEDNARLMVVGPRRMQYNKVITLLDFICKSIEDMYK